MAIEIVSLPIKNGDFPSFFVCLPKGIAYYGRLKHMKVSVRNSRVGLCEERSDANDIGRNISQHLRTVSGPNQIPQS